MSEKTAAILGAGTMGRGLAQLAATSGYEVLLYDLADGAAQKGILEIRAQLRRRVERGKLSEQESGEVLRRIRVMSSLAEVREAAVVIEAVREDIAVKKALFAEVTPRNPRALFATNTSSLSVTAIAAAAEDPSSVIGLHFFNPAPVMKLVEVVAALQTAEETVKRALALAADWGKTAVRSSDSPGFIVNRVARPFYGECLKLAEEGYAEPAAIDAAMRQFGRFKMGPFELMDLIGIDINYAVTMNVFEGFYYDHRYRPSVLQRRLLEAGRLGRKSGEGFYRYGPGSVREEVQVDPEFGEALVLRILALLVNEAHEALLQRVCTRDDLETAMIQGVSYPQGLLAWGEELGLPRLLEELERLQNRSGDPRYRPSALLRERVEGL